MLTRSLIAGAMIAGALAGPGAAEDEISATYDLYLSGLPLAELTFKAKQAGDSYDAVSTIRTVSPLRLMYKADVKAETQGAIAANAFAPQKFTAFSRTSKKTQLVEMGYAGGAPFQVTADPPFKPKPYEVDPRAQIGAVDPLSAALTTFRPAPIEQICPSSADVFDGRRRYTVSLEAPQPDTQFGDYKCEALYKRVAGFKPKMMREQSEFPLTVWFKRAEDGRVTVRRVAAPTKFGNVVVLRREGD